MIILEGAELISTVQHTRTWTVRVEERRTCKTRPYKLYNAQWFWFKQPIHKATTRR
jgi:hypothetical protein